MREKPLVLVVDDEENFLEIFTSMLAAVGFDTARARNGDEALAQAERLMPDLVLMDIRMPGVSGTDAALAIKQNPKTKGIKIAFLTSVADPWPSVGASAIKLAKELGMDDYIEKSRNLGDIVKKVREIVERE